MDRDARDTMQQYPYRFFCMGNANNISSMLVILVSRDDFNS